MGIKQLSQRHDAPNAAFIDTGGNYNFLVPSVPVKAEMSDLLVRFVDVGKIAAMYLEKDDTLSSVCRVW